MFKIKFNQCSFRRLLLDNFQKKYAFLYKGVVLDIGGRDRGLFKKPKQEVKKWIFADIESTHNPDIVLDVANMNNIFDKSIDVINAIELFEHVEKIEDGLRECYRVLKDDGLMIISVPFLFQIHGDPYDYQRWTIEKWRMELKKYNFKINKIEIMGRVFTLLADIIRNIFNSLPRPVNRISYLFYPFLLFLSKIDNTRFVLKSNLKNYHGGYFMIIKK